MFMLTGKVAVITGGASGIGLATAERFVQAGATVVLADIADGAAIAAELGGTFHRTNVAEEADVSSLIDHAVDVHGGVDIMVNNAGILGPGRGVLTDSLAEIREVIDVNLFGVIHGTKYAAQVMTRGGSIVNTASMAGLIGFPGISAYGASKHGVVGYTKNIAIELGPKGIRANCVCPTGVQTPMIQEAPEDHWAVRSQSLANQHVNRLAVADEVAAAIHFLASDDAAMINGNALEVDGGMHVGMSVQLVEALLDTPIHDDEGVFE
ncbi:MAG: SDR family NAD(P)-dependent oxidoreductase [Acidimicrobiia bacterium]|nr:SDR family NAD(P)-dependent oxidoreductase [Acidimicrobiia bacterium]